MPHEISIYYRTYLNFSNKQASAYSVDPDQTPQNVTSNQGLHCSPFIQQFQTHEHVVKQTWKKLGEFWKGVQIR